MRTAIITIIFITTCIIFMYMSGCIDNNNAQDPELKISAGQKNLPEKVKDESSARRL